MTIQRGRVIERRGRSHRLATNDLEGSGACTFIVEARGDLDGDAIFSIYTLSGTIDANGAVIEPLEILDPFE